jgi:Domain of Unknown Function (DUF1259)
MIANRFRLFAFVAALMCAGVAAEAFQQTALDVNAIERAAGVPITIKPDGVVRIGWSRDDVVVTVDGMRFVPQAGLGSWAAFAALPSGKVMVMGDTVVFEDEITPAMDAAFGHGLNVTALHNHFVFDRPPVYFMHVGGTGDEAQLAAGVRAMWDAIKALRRAHPEPQSTFDANVPVQTGDFNTAALEQILGGMSSKNNGVVKFTFGRAASMQGLTFGASMGLATWAAFSGTQDSAVVDGDFAMTAREVQPVMRSLRRSGIHVVALHNHMIGEDPSFYFLHYWGKGGAADLARGLRTALDAQAAVPADDPTPAGDNAWEYALRELPWYQNDQNAEAKCLAWLETVGNEGWIVPDLAIATHGVVVGLVPIAVYDPDAVQGFDWGRTVTLRRPKK